MRPQPLLNLLQSVEKQTLYPNEILIIDGSTNEETEIVLKENSFKNLTYFKVDASERGLTKQRNFGIKNVSETAEIICFLDDDVVLDIDYFKSVINTFVKNQDVVGVGGVATNENRWQKKASGSTYSKYQYYQFEDYVIKESQRNIIRNYFGLQSPDKPGIMPLFSNGRTYSYPLTGNIYDVDLLVGMSFNFRKIVYSNLKFSTYFEGYGLYEDADYSLRALNFGKNVIATNAQLIHYHDHSGRPNKFQYGKMVIRNGWYVWHVKYPNPSLKAYFKWHATALLLTNIRLLNVITTSNRKEALTESLGRIVGWFSLIFSAPKVKN